MAVRGSNRGFLRSDAVDVNGALRTASIDSGCAPYQARGVTKLSSFYVNIYSPYTGEVVCGEPPCAPGAAP